jgi:hypothetical protein
MRIISNLILSKTCFSNENMKFFLALILFLIISISTFSQSFYDGSGRLIGKFSKENIYDGSGAQIGKINGDYVYNCKGVQIGKVSNECVYDGSGVRIGKFGEKYLYDGSGKQIGYINGNYIYNGSGIQIGKAVGLNRMQIIVFFYFFIQSKFTSTNR